MKGSASTPSDIHTKGKRKIIFPPELTVSSKSRKGRSASSLDIFDGLVSRNTHEISLRFAGYYALRLQNLNESAWDAIYMGLNRMKVVADFTIEPPSSCQSDDNKDSSESESDGECTKVRDAKSSKHISQPTLSYTEQLYKFLPASAWTTGYTATATATAPTATAAATATATATNPTATNPTATTATATTATATTATATTATATTATATTTADATTTPCNGTATACSFASTAHTIPEASSTSAEESDSKPIETIPIMADLSGDSIAEDFHQTDTCSASSVPPRDEVPQIHSLVVADPSTQISISTNTVIPVSPPTESTLSASPHKRYSASPPSSPALNSTTGIAANVYSAQTPRDPHDSPPTNPLYCDTNKSYHMSAQSTPRSDLDRLSLDNGNFNFHDDIATANTTAISTTNEMSPVSYRCQTRSAAVERSENYDCRIESTKGQIACRSQKEKIMYFEIRNPMSTLYLNVWTSMTLGMKLKSRYSITYAGFMEKIPRNPQVPFLQNAGILCLDGGGVLGISSLKILERIEDEVRKQLDDPSVALIDCFDMICGTSTGGIIALGLMTGLSVAQMRERWDTVSNSVFDGSRTLLSGILMDGYDVERMKAALLENLGWRMMDTYKTPLCFVTATDVTHNPYELFLLRNYTHNYSHISTNEYRGTHNFPIWTAGWATSAAPTYLRGPNVEELSATGINVQPAVQLVDGALRANNPTIVAMEEASRLVGKKLKHFIDSELELLVSVGTGQPTLRQLNETPGIASTFQILKNSGHLLTSSTRVHREVLNWLDDHDDTYFRFNVPGIGDIPLDASEKQHLDTLRKATADYLMDEKHYDVKRLARRLANRARSRAHRSQKSPHHHVPF